MIKLERKEFNNKVRMLKSIDGLQFETGIFDAENARKGMLLEENRKGQVARPWFTRQMTFRNPKLRFLVRAGVKEMLQKKLTRAQYAKLLTDHCKDGLNREDLAPLTEYTLLVKAGLVKRSDTGRTRASKGPAEDIGRDSLAMYKAIKTPPPKVVKKGGKS